MKLVKPLTSPVMTYGAEGCTLKKCVERRLEAAEMWCYRRLLRIRWTEERTHKFNKNNNACLQMNLRSKQTVYVQQNNYIICTHVVT